MIKKEFGKEWMHGTAVSSLKGRLRLNVPGLEFLFEERNEVAQALAKIAGVQRVRVTPRIGSVLLEYDEQRTAASEVLNQTNLVMARYAMNANRVRHSDEKGESTMTVKRLVGRLAVNAAGFLLGNTVFKGSLFGNKLGIINSIPALCSIGLSAPMVRGAWEGLKKDLRPNADFLTVTSIVASLMLGNGNSALMILALSDIAELMTSYTIEKTRASIKQMLSVETGDVWKVLEDGRLEKTSIDKIQAEDTLEIHSGEKIAVDGVVDDDVAAVEGHLDAQDVGLAGLDAAACLLGIQIAAAALIALEGVLALLRGLAIGLELLLGAEAGICLALVPKLLGGLLVQVQALGLGIGAKVAAHLGALVPVKTQPTHGAQDDLRVLVSGTGGVGVVDAQDERTAVGAGKGPVVDGGAGAADMQVPRRAGGEAGYDRHSETLFCVKV